jgi:hypothetical protein
MYSSLAYPSNSLSSLIIAPVKRMLVSALPALVLVAPKSNAPLLLSALLLPLALALSALLQL